MRWDIVRTVFAKDVLSTLRDRRTLLMSFGLPLLLYPVLMVGASRLQDTQRLAIAQRPSRIAVWGVMPDVLGGPLRGDAALNLLMPCDDQVCPPEILQKLASGELAVPARERDDRERARAARERVRANTDASSAAQPLPPLPSDPVVDAASVALASRRVDAIIVASPALGERLSRGEEGELAVLYDSVMPESQEARTRLQDRLEHVRLNLVAAREREAALPEGFGRALWTTVANAATEERRAGFRLGALLPFLLIALSLLGGLYPAIELTAGEKERGTLQTLLCAPIRPVEIVTAKFLAVWVTSMSTAVINVASLGMTISRVLPADGGSLNVPALVAALLMLVPVTFTTSAVFLAVATLARDFKDGQNFLTPVFMALTLPAGLSVLPSMQLDPWTAGVPILNLALGIKATLSGEATPALMLIVAVSSAAYAALAVLLAAQLFQQEQVLLGSPSSLRQVLTPAPSRDGRPSPHVALGTVAVSLVLQFYASTFLQDTGLVTMLLVLQVGLMLMPVVGVVRLAGLTLPTALGFRRSSPRMMLGALLLGVSAWGGVMGIVMRVAPPPEGVSKALEEVLSLRDAEVSLLRLWVLAALLPAICEETLFRGLVLSGTARWGRWSAIAVSSFTFAFAHASIYRVLPTVLLGAMLGYAAWQSRSLVTSMIVHLVNNGVLLTLARYPDALARVGWADSGPPPWTLVLPSIVLTIVGLWLVGSPRAPRLSPNPARQIDSAPKD